MPRSVARSLHRRWLAAVASAVLLAGLLVVTSPSSPAATTIPETALFGVDGTTFLRIHPVTGDILGRAALPDRVTGLAFHPTTNVLYGTTGTETSNPGHLVRINPATGQLTDIGDLFPPDPTGDDCCDDTIQDITFVGNTLYGSSEGNQDLNRINLTTGRATPVADTNIAQYGNGIATDGAGRVFYAPDGEDNAANDNNDAKLYRLNVATGALGAQTDLRGGTSLGAAISALAFACDGRTLYGSWSAFLSQPSRLMTIDLPSGDIDFVNNNVGSQLDAIAFSCLPENTASYYVTRTNGDVTGFGPGGVSYGDAAVTTPSGLTVDGQFVGVASMPRVPGTVVSPGYWLVTSDGKVVPRGLALNFGDLAGVSLNQPIVGIAPHPSGLGYWLVATDGGVFGFGAARFFGSTGNIRLNQPIVGIAAHPAGLGYWLVASDGGIFAFGPGTRFFGSTGNIRLNQPVVGMAAHPLGIGYWLVAADGGIFTFGTGTRFFGSTGSIRLNQPINGMAATGSGNGYWLVAADGGIFAFGDSDFSGSLGGTPGLPVVGISAP